MRIIVAFSCESDLFQQRQSFRLDFFLYLTPAGAVIRPLLCGEQWSQSDVLQCSILGEEVEILEHHPEMQAVLANCAFRHQVIFRRVQQEPAVHIDPAAVGTLQEIQAAKQCCLAAAGGTENGQNASPFHCEADILQNPDAAKFLFQVLYFKNCHGVLLSGNSSASFPACREEALRYR